MDTENTEQATIPKEISSYKLAKYDATNIKQQIDNKKNISITLGNNTYDLGLVPNPIRSEDFETVLAVNGKHIEVPLEQVNTYKGIVIGQDFSDLRITISRDGIYGFIKTENDDKFYPTSTSNPTTSVYSYNGKGGYGGSVTESTNPA